MQEQKHADNEGFIQRKAGQYQTYLTCRTSVVALQTTRFILTTCTGWSEGRRD